jgi:hypothetical protein
MREVRDPAVQSGPSTVQVPRAAQARATGADGAAAPTASPGRRTWLIGLAGLLAGAALGYLGAAQLAREQLAATTQAAELRVQAANQRIEELQAQLHDANEQAQRQQLALVDQAEEQQRKLVRQTSEQEHAAAAQQQVQLAQAQQRAADAQKAAAQAAAQAQARERDLARPDLPVRVWVHKPLVGRGLVGQAHNFGTTDLQVTITWQPASGATQQWQTRLAANANLALGRDAPWILSNGDDLRFEAEGYRPLEFPIRPKSKTSDPAPH